MGFQIVVVIMIKKVVRVKFPIPLRIGTIRYSIRHQGFINSIRNKFSVPLSYKEE